MANLDAVGEPGHALECEFRVINELDGLRWLRIMSPPLRVGIPAG